MSQPAELGVIYDIGYRHYDGPRLGRGYLMRSLYAESLKGAFGLGRSAKSKVMPVLLLVAMTLPALVIALVTGITDADSLPLAYTRYPVVLSSAISVFVASQSPASVSRDLRFRVLPLYLSRPLTRGDYVLAKLSAMTTAVFAIIAIPLVVLYAGALLAKLPFWAQTRGVLAGLVGAAVFAVVFASIGLLVASVTPRRGFGVAAVIAVLLLLGIISGTLQGVADSSGRDTLAGYFGAISPVSLVDGVQVWVLNADPSTVAGPPGNLGGAVFVVVTLALVAACYAGLQLRYRRVSAS